MTMVVTGAASGLGCAIAERFVRRRLRVALVDRDEQRLLEVRQSLQGVADRDDAEIFPLDVTDAGSVAQTFDAIRARLGAITMLVNAAGVADLRPATELPLDVWNRTFAVNVTGTLLCSLEAAHDMRAIGDGRIVNIASVSGLRASVGRVAYGPSKAAVISLTAHLAVEWASDGITVNAIAPGPIETPMAASVHNTIARQAYTDRIPLHRYGQPSDIVAAVEYLVSDGARYVTGQTIAVDGGYAIAGLLDPRMLQSDHPLRTQL